MQNGRIAGLMKGEAALRRSFYRFFQAFCESSHAVKNFNTIYRINLRFDVAVPLPSAEIMARRLRL